MTWLIILQIVWEIIKLIAKRNNDAKVPGLLARLREARNKAKETGDTSDLEKLRQDAKRP